MGAGSAAGSSTAPGGTPGAGGFANIAVDFVVGLFGPNYDPANGGEVDRQLQAMEEWRTNQPLIDAYKWYLQTYHPQLWQTGNIWDAPNSFDGGHPSRFRDRYLLLVEQGEVPGSFLLEQGGGVRHPANTDYNQDGRVRDADGHGTSKNIPPTDGEPWYKKLRWTITHPKEWGPGIIAIVVIVSAGVVYLVYRMVRKKKPRVRRKRVIRMPRFIRRKKTSSIR